MKGARQGKGRAAGFGTANKRWQDKLRSFLLTKRVLYVRVSQRRRKEEEKESEVRLNSTAKAKVRVRFCKHAKARQTSALLDNQILYCASRELKRKKMNEEEEEVWRTTKELEKYVASSAQ